MTNSWIYDWETFPNYSCVTFLNLKSDDCKIYEFVGDSTDTLTLSGMKAWLDIQKNKKDEFWLCGYNNLSFDNPITLSLIKEPKLIKNVPKFIKDIGDETIRKERKPYLSCYTPYFNTIDIFRLLNLDSSFISLKHCAIMIKWHNIQDNPFNHTDHITKEQRKQVLEYNMNDVLITRELFRLNSDAIRQRYISTRKYKIDLMNLSDVKRGAKVVETLLKAKIGDIDSQGTPRDKVDYRDCISDKITFKTPLCNDFLDRLKGTTVSALNSGKMDFELWIGDTLYKMGMGGIHSKDASGICESTNTDTIKDVDVKAYYPSIICNFGIHPEHIDKKMFLFTYKHEIVLKREDARERGDKVESNNLKLCANSIVGKMGEETPGVFHDKKAFLSVTLNGQLSILMLIEELHLQGFKIISANTDGITAIVPTDKANLFNSICKEWERNTRFNLEYVDYKAIYKISVNEYFAIDVNGKVKEKGIFLTDVTKKEYNKGYDKPIVAMAVKAFFLDKVPVEKYITEHKDILDFCMAQKVGSQYDLMYKTLDYVDGENITTLKKVQRTCRYYVTTDHKSLYKHKEGKDEMLCAGFNTALLNYFDKDRPFESYNINYKYYIAETNKIIDKMLNKNTLF